MCIDELEDWKNKQQAAPAGLEERVTSPRSAEAEPDFKFLLSDLLNNRSCVCGGWTCPRCIISVDESAEALGREVPALPGQPSPAPHNLTKCLDALDSAIGGLKVRYSRDRGEPDPTPAFPYEAALSVENYHLLLEAVSAIKVELATSSVNLNCPKCGLKIGWNCNRGWFHMKDSSCSGIRDIPWPEPELNPLGRFEATVKLWDEYRRNRPDLPEFDRLPVDTQLFSQYIVASGPSQPSEGPRMVHMPPLGATAGTHELKEDAVAKSSPEKSGDGQSELVSRCNPQSPEVLSEGLEQALRESLSALIARIENAGIEDFCPSEMESARKLLARHFSGGKGAEGK